MKLLHFAVLAGSLLAAVASAGNLEIRLVAAGNDRTDMDPELADIADFLRENLPFSRFELLGRERVSLPGKHTLQLPRNLEVRCQGDAGDLRMELHHGDRQKPLLRTTLQLQPGEPLVLGGTRDEKGNLILVFLAD